MDHGVPAQELADDELERQGVHAHATRHWVFLHGTAEQFRTHTQRMLELEQEYLHRHPQRTWQGSGAAGEPAGAAPVTAESQAARIRDLVSTFVREIDYLLGTDQQDADSEPGPAELALLARVAASPGRRMHKLEIHQAARELGSSPRAVARLYKGEQARLRADGEERVLTEAGTQLLAQDGSPA